VPHPCVFLQAWAAKLAKLPTQLLSVLHKPVAYAVVVPALRQEREGRGTHCVGNASEIKSLVTRLPLGPPSVKRAHLDRRPTGDGSLAPPRECIIQISGFQHPKTPICSLVSRYGPSVMRTLPSGCARSDLALLAGERCVGSA
jgi:hypothetical protein